MIIDKKLEINFIKAIQKNRSSRTILENNLLFKRNLLIDRQFEWTSLVYQKLIFLNECLRKEELRIFQQYKLIENKCKEMVLNRQIDDYNIELQTLYWNNKHYKKYIPSIEGNPFYETIDSFMLFQASYEQYNSEPHNDNYPMSPLPEINHCYSFHHLYDHSDLTWFDIYNIDEVCMQIEVHYQFAKKVKLKRFL